MQRRINRLFILEPYSSAPLSATPTAARARRLPITPASPLALHLRAVQTLIFGVLAIHPRIAGAHHLGVYVQSAEVHVADRAAVAVLAFIIDADLPAEYQSAQCLLRALSVILVGLRRIDLGEANLHLLVIDQHC